MIDISEALKQIDQNSVKEKISLMNAICERIMRRENPTDTSLAEYIFAMHGFEWNKPATYEERITSRTYDQMVKNHPAYCVGTPVARMRILQGNHNHFLGTADPIFIGRYSTPVYTLELMKRDDGTVNYLGKVCLRLCDVYASSNTTQQDLTSADISLLESLGDADNIEKIESIDLVVSSTERDGQGHKSYNVESFTDVAYGWNDILAESDLSNDKGPKLLGHIAALMNRWQD